MSTPPRTTTLKSLPATPTGPAAAEHGSSASEGGAPKDAARQGVLSALRSDQHQADGRYPIAWLHITAPRAAVPTATSTCACGRDRSAVGRRRVLELIEDHNTHRDTCPLRTPTEGRAAA